MSNPNIYATPAAKVGKHEWRQCVRLFEFGGYYGIPRHTEPATVWEFRRIGADEWQDRKLWPSWDHNKWDDGLPAGLVKIWERHKREIYAALGKPLEPEPEMQTALTF
jgi:hypothetical protein